ncbi:hypothetical protein [uncultured Campylobacter sp.]|uniref:hypothetical protein n=1 Tax=uncultured Campylobacter sp. TaxID=218934 RepID=UPI0015B0D1F8|nr:hypothetical protein [uncultured Campylobacter sp.]
MARFVKQGMSFAKRIALYGVGTVLLAEQGGVMQSGAHWGGRVLRVMIKPRR